MESLYFSAQLGDNRHLILGPLSSRKKASSIDDVPDDSGYFLFEQIGNGPSMVVNILAQVHSDEAAMQLSRMFNMS